MASGTTTWPSGALRAGDPHPWAAKRCLNNLDPNPLETSVNACLTDGQISALEFNTRRYHFSEPLANGTLSFGARCEYRPKFSAMSKAAAFGRQALRTGRIRSPAAGFIG
jgi:hypothetical protein